MSQTSMSFFIDCSERKSIFMNCIAIALASYVALASLVGNAPLIVTNKS